MIKTSEKFIEEKHGDQLGLFTRSEIKELMVEFAKRWVEYALNEAENKFQVGIAQIEEDLKIVGNRGNYIREHFRGEYSIINSVNLEDVI